ncbi:MAG: chromosome segregation protein SMC [Clostridia bacterium]
MNLKRIEAYGFKSFADKMVLEFKSGVTCIVGPNGCGKSNVSDAIRWVLGEQSSKNLRGKKMQDVIFSGTQNRRAMGYCEVSLVFDNTNHTYEYDAEEITVLRKLYRNGDSEYLINGEKTRLKDILDLFRDTGIGKDGYSVVGQGRVESFISSRPEDRRLVFEEAAGISKYRERRKIAQRKLERTDDNLLRVLDKMEVYKQQIGPLEKQSKATLKARDLRDNIKILEVNSFIYLSENTAEEKTKLVEKLNSVNVGILKNEQKRVEVNTKYQANEEQLQQLDFVSDNLNQQKLDISVALADLKGEMKFLNGRYHDLKQNIDETNKSIELKGNSVSNCSIAVEVCNQEKQSVLKEFSESKEKELVLKEELDGLNEKVEQQKKEIDTANDMLLSSADMLGEINGGIIKLHTEISSLNEMIVNLSQDKDEKTKNLREDVKIKTNLAEQLENINNEKLEKEGIKKDIDKQYSAKLVEFEGNQDQQSELNNTISKLKSRYDTLSNLNRNNGTMDDSVRYLLNSNDPEIKSKVLGVVGKLINIVDPKYATAIEIALGGSINNIVVETRADAAFLISQIKNSGIRGRVTILPIEAMRPNPLEDNLLQALDTNGCLGVAADLLRYDRKYRRVIETLLGRVAVAEDTYVANSMARDTGNRLKIVTLDGEYYANNGSISGGSKGKQGSTSMLSIEADIDKCKKQLTQATQDYQIIEKEVKEAEKQLREMETASSVLNNLISKLDKDSIIAANKIESFDNEIKSLTESIEKINATINDHKKNIEIKQNLYDIEKNKGSDTTNKRSGADELRSSLANELNARENARNDKYEKYNDFKVKVNGLEHKLDELENTIKTNTITMKRNENEILEEKSKNAVNKAEFARITKQIEEMEIKDINNEELNNLQKEIDATQIKKIDLKKEQEILRSEEMKISDVLGTLKSQQGRLETNLEKIDVELTTMSERVKDEYELDYELALKYKVEDFDKTKVNDKIRILKRELNNLGDINEQAVEALQTINAEFVDLQTKYNDVSLAKTDLESTIKTLTKEMETNFEESFDKIKEYFSEVFVELFGGGVAKLGLDRKKDESVLEAGIEISAEPPGKKLTNIDLLSGGEKALTAIAIIFAIIKLHPMPFCVLDEVDAPLDETNAVRYAKFLRKFSVNTQFIIVSHRKPTMQLADDLYGITMQEKGVSKFLQVNMSEAMDYAKTGEHA